MSIPRLKRNIITPGMVGDDRRERERQVVELNHQLDEIYGWLAAIAGAGTTGELAPGDGPFVLHGDTVPEGLPEAALHRDMTGDDLHWPKYHGARHNLTGVDPLTVGTPVQVGSANAQGAGPGWSAEDHVHQSRYGFIWQENPSGAINGANNTFTFASGTKSFSYDASEIPQVNDWHRVYYVYDGGVIDDDSIMVFKNGVLYLDALGITLGVPAGGGFASLLGIVGI